MELLRWPGTIGWLSLDHKATWERRGKLLPTAPEFAGFPGVRQHQMVYAALKGKMGGELHALALKTRAPD